MLSTAPNSEFSILAPEVSSYPPNRAQSHLVIPVDAYSGRAVMAMDVYQAGNYSCVEIDMPGFDPATIEIDIEGGVLTVSARRLRQNFGPDDVEVAEREYGSFSRELYVCETLDLHDLGIEYAHGVLKISVPTVARAASNSLEPSQQRPGI